MKHTMCLAGALLSLAVVSTPVGAQTETTTSPHRLLLIMDASGSMWGQIEGENKIVIARRVLKDLLGDLTSETEVGLVAYGHRREGDCEDIETVVPVGALDSGIVAGRIDAINPKGKTPINGAVREAIDLARTQDGPTTIVLVSDGIETCGGDACETIHSARADGVDFIMHVIGFDVAEADVSGLECAAQAGGGLYLSAEDADGLAGALDQAVAIPAEMPAGRLSVRAIAEGGLQDALVRVLPPGSDDEVASSRTYATSATNPRVIPLPPGTYDVEARAIGLRGNVSTRFEAVEVPADSVRELIADFRAGELGIHIMRNGELSDATVDVYRAGTQERVAGGRTYTGSGTNPMVLELTAATYDVVVRSVEIAGRPEARFENVSVRGSQRADRTHEFSSGTLRIGAVAGGELVDAVVQIRDAVTGSQVDQSRTYTRAVSNPSEFTLSPGRYRVRIQAVRLEGRPVREIDVVVDKAGVVEQMVELGG